MPGVQFYYDKDVTLKKYFGSYTQGHDWNAPGAITDADKQGPNDFVLKEEGILDTLKNKASAYATTDGVADGVKFFKLIIDIANGVNKDYTLYILKGIHSKPQLHFSVGFAGKIYHLNVKRRGDDRTKFSISSMSEGGQTWDDPEWKVVRK
jgi:hypothetical protein